MHHAAGGYDAGAMGEFDVSIFLAQFLRDTFQVRRPEDLSIKQASQAIDDLKSAAVGKGG